MPCFDFEGIAPGTQLTVFVTNPVPTNMLTTVAGSIWGAAFVSQSGGSTLSGFTKIYGAGEIEGPTTQSINVNNILMCIGAKKQQPLSSITFDYWASGGNLNLLVNGVFVNFNDFSDINGSTFGGATVSITGNQQAGMVEIAGDIDMQYLFGHIGIGGQELWIDNVCWVE